MNAVNECKLEIEIAKVEMEVITNYELGLAKTQHEPGSERWRWFDLMRSISFNHCEVKGSHETSAWNQGQWWGAINFIVVDEDN